MHCVVCMREGCVVRGTQLPAPSLPPPPPPQVSHASLRSLCQSLKYSCELFPSREIVLCSDPYSGLGLALWCAARWGNRQTDMHTHTQSGRLDRQTL